MKIFLDFLRAFFISIEFLTLLVAIPLKNQIEEFILNSISKFDSDSRIMEFMVLLPIGIFIWISKEYWSILFPSEERRAIFSVWPHFYMLKNRLIVSLIYSFMAIPICAMSFVYKPWNSETKVFVFGLFLSVQIIVATSVYFGKIRIKEIIDKAK